MIREVSTTFALAALTVLCHATVLPTTVLQSTPSGTSYAFGGYGLTISSDFVFTGSTWGPPFEQWNGLWISQNETANMRFAFDAPVTNLHIKFTALTLLDANEEWWDNFRADGNTVGVSLQDNNMGGHECVLDAGAVKPLVNDGWGTVVYSGSVSTFEFLHDTIKGSPNGAVITEMSWDPVPEPATFIAVGLGFVAILKRRRRK